MAACYGRVGAPFCRPQSSQRGLREQKRERGTWSPWPFCESTRPEDGQEAVGAGGMAQKPRPQERGGLEVYREGDEGKKRSIVYRDPNRGGGSRVRETGRCCGERGAPCAVSPFLWASSCSFASYPRRKTATFPKLPVTVSRAKTQNPVSKQDRVSCLAASDRKALAFSKDAAALHPSGPLKLPLEGTVWQGTDPSL